MSKDKDETPVPDAPLLDRVLLPTKSRHYVVAPAHILYCEADGAYTRVFLANGDAIMLSCSLSQVEKLLRQWPFFRAHHSCLVNLCHVLSVSAQDGFQIHLSDGAVLPLARARRKQLWACFHQL